MEIFLLLHHPCILKIIPSEIEYLILKHTPVFRMLTLCLVFYASLVITEFNLFGIKVVLGSYNELQNFSFSPLLLGIVFIILGLSMYQFLEAAITENYKLGGLKQQKFIFLQFQRLEAQHQDVSRATLLPETLEKILLSLSASHGQYCTTPIYFHCHVYSSDFIGFMAHLDNLRQSPHLRILDLIIPTRDLCSNKVNIPRCQ